MSFIHLHLHTEYSIQDSMVRIPVLMDSLRAMSMPAVAITDWMNLFAVVKFYRRAVAAGIKPIIGADVMIARDGVESKCVLLCQDEQGYRNLTELVSHAYVEREGDKLSIPWETLKEKSAGLLAIQGIAGEIGFYLQEGKNDLALAAVKCWEECFADRLYFAIERVGRPNERAFNDQAIAYSIDHQIPVVATNGVCFISRSDFDAHEARVCINQGRVLIDSTRPKTYQPAQYLRTADEMQHIFADCPAAIANTWEVAKRCSLNLDLGKVFLPNFEVPAGQTLTDYLRSQAQEGMRQRLAERAQEPAYQQRLQLEIDVIDSMGFPGYFLIVADFINWAKTQDIPVGPGRGSGAGSLVAYVLGITELDPIEFELLFERFLNPERVSMPDFDIDFCMTNRDRVIEYVANRYGHEAVSQIITYGTMAAKAVVRDVGRVMSFPYGFVDKIAKLIPFELGITLDKALNQEPALAERYESEDDVRMLIDMAKKLEGVTRNAGKHAGGVVIAPTKLTDFTPLYCEADSPQLVSQFDKDDVEAVGLVKFDFLGLRTLTIIHECIQLIVQNPNNDISSAIDINAIPLNDKKTFELLRRCETTAVFQLESRGMKDLVHRLQPDRFEDLIALVALFRPGPLQSGMVDDFIDRKHGRQKVHYPHPELAPILSDTYGVILYQEQVMKIAQVLASYTLGGADLLRRAMGKKKIEEMEKQRSIFLDGAVKRDIDARLANEIFDIMEKFAGYGFNKSHSAAYALIAYQTAWLKAHYPAEFMAAVLSSDMDNTDKVSAFHQEAVRMGLKVLPPDVNSGQYHFTVDEKNRIVYGLGAIKGVGEAAVVHMIECREQDGLYRHLFDFTKRVDLHKISRRVLEPLITSGAMDGFSQTRATLLATLESAHKAAQQFQADRLSGQNDLFAADDSLQDDEQLVQYIEQQEWDLFQLLRREKLAVGLYLSGHPIQVCEKELQRLVTAGCGQLRTPNSAVVIAGIVISQRVIMTKTGKRMAVIAVEDRSGKVDVTIFNDLYTQVMDKLATDEVLILRGQTSLDQFTRAIKVVAESVHTLDEIRSSQARQLCMRVDSDEIVKRVCEQLPEVLRPYLGGSCQITAFYRSATGNAQINFGQQWRVSPTSELISQLSSLLGEDAIRLVYA